MRKTISMLAVAFLTVGCKSSPPIQAVSTLEEVMHHMVIPNAQVIWKSTGTIYTVGHVQEIKPQTDEEWLNLEAASTILTEAGNLLMMDGRAKDTGKWMERARALREAGTSLHQAAKSRDVAAVFERGGNLFDACQNCHFTYRYTTKDPNSFRSH
jgi:hypothetical protein